jgi:MYXO-CTERM domain-containing protein
MFPISRSRAILAVLLLSLPASHAAATLIGPTPYTGFAGSPFSAVAFVSFQLEDFEDGVLNAADVSADDGFVLGPGFGLTDSVENAPDGCNPSGAGGGPHGCAGWSYYPTATALTFTFSGALPTHAGVVWTDVGYELGGILDGVADVIFEAFDQDGLSLGTIGPVALGNGSAAPSTGEDRFFGAENPGGISRITISMPTSEDWEIDHLQFGIGSGSAIPEPATALQIAAGLLGLAAAGRRRRR